MPSSSYFSWIFCCRVSCSSGFGWDTGRDDCEGRDEGGTVGRGGGGFRTAGGGCPEFATTERGGVGTDAPAGGRFFRTTTRGVGSEAFCAGMASPSSASSTTIGIV